jgi:hypothetical protein
MKGFCEEGRECIQINPFAMQGFLCEELLQWKKEKPCQNFLTGLAEIEFVRG